MYKVPLAGVVTVPSDVVPLRNSTLVIDWPGTSVAFAQNQNPPLAAPGQLATPAWRMVLTMADGRRLITDGAMAIDITIAKPATTPTTEAPSSAAKLFEGYMARPYTSEFGPSDISTGSLAGTYAGPGGLLLNATHVNFLRERVPVARLRFGVKGPLDPIVILVGGTPVGIVMRVAGLR